MGENNLSLQLNSLRAFKKKNEMRKKCVLFSLIFIILPYLSYLPKKAKERKKNNKNIVTLNAERPFLFFCMLAPYLLHRVLEKKERKKNKNFHFF